MACCEVYTNVVALLLLLLVEERITEFSVNMCPYKCQPICY